MGLPQIGTAPKGRKYKPRLWILHAPAGRCAPNTFPSGKVPPKGADEGRGALADSFAVVPKRSCSTTLISLLRFRSADSFPQGKPRGFRKSALPQKAESTNRDCGFCTHRQDGAHQIPSPRGRCPRRGADEGRGALTDSFAVVPKRSCSPTLISLRSEAPQTASPRGSQGVVQIGTAPKVRHRRPMSSLHGSRWAMQVLICSQTARNCCCTSRFVKRSTVTPYCSSSIRVRFSSYRCCAAV